MLTSLKIVTPYVRRMLFLHAKKVFEKVWVWLKWMMSPSATEKHLGATNSTGVSFELSPVCRIMDPNTEICIYI
jgi:hypothetical protein